MSNFLSTLLGVLAGGFISIIVFQWQRIKKEQSFAKILINILENGEVNELIKVYEDVNKEITKKEKDEIKERDYFDFLFKLYMIYPILVSQLPDLRTSYEIGTGYVYEIYDLRNIYTYFDAIEKYIRFSIDHEAKKDEAYESVYNEINKLIDKIPNGIEKSISKLKSFESKSPFKLALKLFIPFFNN